MDSMPALCLSTAVYMDSTPVYILSISVYHSFLAVIKNFRIVIKKYLTMGPVQGAELQGGRYYRDGGRIIDK